MPTPLTVVGIGNAIVDVISHAEDAFITQHKLNKGTMTLIDSDQARALYSKMGPGIEMSGGSAANTIAGLATLGGQCGFIGKVCDDELGDVFRHDITAVGVKYATPPLNEDPPTARCLIVVTPDAQRTMHTYLGASVELGPDDIDADIIGGAQITYLEGYLWDRPKAKEAFRTAATIARESGRKVALTLSDVFCVERHRDSFRELIDGHVDILFGNEDEMRALYQTETLEDAFSAVRGECGIVAITRSERGSLIMEGPTLYEVPAAPVDRIVDTTGAGDLYAAGFLHGLTRGKHLAECGRLGSLAAAEVLTHYGARPECDLNEWIAARSA
ncbi:MAG: adenosine kinase [Alphaproteobacteria bacterium]|jgi:sugar/nucleoside kinase (ribokinase family)|nr:adenosine kinase [Alphaproteobacteria bacterium]